MATAYHLFADLWAIPESRAYLLRHPAHVLALMERIRRSVKMETLVTPIIIYAQGDGTAWGPGVTNGNLLQSIHPGVRAIVPLTDSHATSHALEKEAKVHFDLFACKVFDWQDVAHQLQEAYRGHGRAVLLDRSDPTLSPTEMVVGEKRW